MYFVLSPKRKCGTCNAKYIFKDEEPKQIRLLTTFLYFCIISPSKSVSLKVLLVFEFCGDQQPNNHQGLHISPLVPEGPAKLIENLSELGFCEA